MPCAFRASLGPWRRVLEGRPLLLCFCGGIMRIHETPIRNQPDDAMRRTYMLMGVAAILAFLVLASLALRLLS